jgi:hypothetical protein
MDTSAGLTAFLIIRMWFGKAVDDFNLDIITLGQSGPQLVASIGNGFTSAYSFFLPFVVSTIATGYFRLLSVCLYYPYCSIFSGLGCVRLPRRPTRLHAHEASCHGWWRWWKVSTRSCAPLRCMSLPYLLCYES